MGEACAFACNCSRLPKRSAPSGPRRRKVSEPGGSARRKRHERRQGASRRTVFDVTAAGNQHIRCACEEMEDMRKQFERVLGVRLSDKARKLRRAHMPGSTVGFLDDSMTLSRNSCCTTVRKRVGTRKRQTGSTIFHGELNTYEATDNASTAVPARQEGEAV